MAEWDKQRTKDGKGGDYGKVINLGGTPEAPVEVMGVYLGKHMGNYGHPLYDFEGEGGEPFSLTHNFQLGERLLDELKGRLVLVRFKGKDKTKRGGTVKQFEVMVARPESITEDERKRFPALNRPVQQVAGDYELPEELPEEAAAGDELPF